MKRYLISLIFVIIIYNKLAAQPPSCQIKNVTPITNYGEIGGNLYQVGSVKNLTINIYLKDTVFQSGKDLYSAVGNRKPVIKGSELKLDTTDKKRVATEIFKTLNTDECVKEIINAKIANGQFNVYKDTAKTVTVVKYLFEEGELDNYNLKNIYDPSEGVTRIRENNSYYFKNIKGDFLITMEDGQNKEFQYAYDFKGGKALIGNPDNSGKMAYHFIDKKGNLDSTEYSNFIRKPGYLFLKKIKDKTVDVFDNNNTRILANIDEDLRKGMAADEIRKSYRKKIDTIDLNFKTYLVTSIFEDFFLMNIRGKATTYTFTNYAGNFKRKTLLFIKSTDSLFIYNPKTEKASDYYLAVTDLNNSNFFIITRHSGKKNLIDEKLEPILLSDYDAISLKENNLVCNGNDEKKSERFTLAGNKLTSEGIYERLTQYDTLGFGFWFKKSDSTTQSALYSKSSVTVLNKIVNRCHIYGLSDPPTAHSIINFGGFTVDGVGVVDVEGMSQALINTDTTFLILPVCLHDIIGITLVPDPVKKCTIVYEYYVHNGLNSFLCRKGKVVTSGLDYLESFPNTNLYLSWDRNRFSCKLLNADGKSTTERSFSKILAPDANGFIRVFYSISPPNFSNAKCGLLDENGYLILDCLYDSIKIFKKDYFFVKTGPRQWHIMKNKTVKATDYPTLIYDDLNIIARDSIIVQAGNKFGLVSWQGKFFLDTVYDAISYDGKLFNCRINRRSFFLQPSPPGSKSNWICSPPDDCEYFNELRRKESIKFHSDSLNK